ncbi:Histidine kinase-, DNA gyrase B-, and HSP90-like ATPase [Caminicella sporogenes DSM 14501]|uniref:Histidine kinase-, DNA gyrase B-, and HSP90-like ATPase n=1 Tax=Caminicella sporogenes DSM 14501 TaxID=1121266 RepID=A0A1M6MJP9_9FIRM|nr:histidine kinase [Caminicella sporogenes]RKD27519.1 ATPase [Caminicella sporogenes]SHJ83711.1 Histidine kinase-, DNA gyrase B-, and HSP90-like ATPase [Caminicella sporogenes DSM 14501]
MIKRFLKFTGIRKKLIIYYLIITILFGLVSGFSYYNAKLVLIKLESIITDYVYLNDLNNDVNSLMLSVERYLTTRSSDALLNYYTCYNKLQEKSMSISREAVYDIDKIMLKDIGFMIDELLDKTDKAVNAKRGRISNEYISYYRRSNEISEYIKFYINELLNSKLQKGSEKYVSTTRNMNYISYFNLFLIILSTLISIFLALFFTYKLTKPIIELSNSAERISKGDYNIEPVKIKTNDEIDILIKAFNKMVVNIKRHIEEIKGQAEIEKKLKEQEMQNLKMKSLLKDAELKSLQSQINPHFLFNTLNAASQLSMMEGADRASEFIQSVAELFRYNLRKLEKPVSLRDEINYVKNYMYILKTRFGDKISFYTNIDETLLDIKIPCIIIQPIVENSYIHGLEDLERNGEIHLNVKRKDNKVLIEIIDNGIGIKKEDIDKILYDKSSKSSKKHVTGIGMHNVINRLKLFFNISDVEEIIEIESKIGIGTKVTLKIPYCEDVILV